MFTESATAMLSQGASTHIGMLALDDAVVESQTGMLVIRALKQPEFHWGHYIQVTDGDVNDAAHWVNQFECYLSMVDWYSLALPRVPECIDSYQELGFEIEFEEVRTQKTAPPPRACPKGFQARPLSSPADWQQMENLAAAQELEDSGEVTPARRRFIADKSLSRQRLVQSGVMSWWGMFNKYGDLCGDLGIVVIGKRARYQSVGTASSYRRMGIASHLLGQAAGWALEKGAEELVIVSDQGSEAGRLYELLGFRQVATDVSAYRKPPRI